MFVSFKNLTQILDSCLRSSNRKLCSKLFGEMNNTTVKKTRYDGRSKKRKWEDRRSDKGEGLQCQTKHGKFEKTTEVPVEKIIDKIKRRKFVLLMGYSGVGYFGMQRNPSQDTIEEELFKALKNVGLITDLEFNQVQNLSFQRAARTDKGVSASRQIVSLKLPENIDLSKINTQLPDQIQVFDYKRVTKGFNCKTLCDSRTYTYMLPTVAFADLNESVDQKKYRISASTLTRINDVLNNFVGTKNFHNYTAKKKCTDPSASRYIMFFKCDEPLVIKDVEFVVLKVRGQSFMLHQIRKMVGALLAVIRGLAPNEIIPKSLGMEKVCIPRAPGLGLVLDYVHYERYNNRYGDDGIHQKLTWEEVEDKVNQFKEKYIYPTIVNTEIEEENMLWWIQNKLSKHSYDDEDNNYDSDDEKEDDGDELDATGDDDTRENDALSPEKKDNVDENVESKKDVFVASSIS